MDDSAASRQRKAELLARHGYLVSAIATQEEAGVLCRQRSFTLILVVDRRDPQRAADFCRSVRRQNPQQRIGLLLDTNRPAPVTDCPDLIWPDEGDDYFLARVETLTAFAFAA
jgi:PleD family two-component response regulator